MAFSDIINRELLSAALGEFKTKLATIFAPLNSPAMTGTPTAPTAEAGTDTTQIATTAFATAAARDKNVKVVTVSNLVSLDDPVAVQGAEITADMAVVRAVLNNPAAQLCDWTVTAANGSLTIAKAGTKTGVGYGGTNLTLYLMHTGSETAQVSTIKNGEACPPAGTYYSRTFTPDDEESIFNDSIVSAGRIDVYKVGPNIVIRVQNATFSSALSAYTGYTLATLPENARGMLTQQGHFATGDGSCSGRLNIAAGTGIITVIPNETAFPAGTSFNLNVPYYMLSRDHDDQDLTGYTLIAPSAT